MLKTSYQRTASRMTKRFVKNLETWNPSSESCRTQTLSWQVARVIFDEVVEKHRYTSVSDTLNSTWEHDCSWEKLSSLLNHSHVVDSPRYLYYDPIPKLLLLKKFQNVFRLLLNNSIIWIVPFGATLQSVHQTKYILVHHNAQNTLKGSVWFFQG